MLRDAGVMLRDGGQRLDGAPDADVHFRQVDCEWRGWLTVCPYMPGLGFANDRVCVACGRMSVGRGRLYAGVCPQARRFYKPGRQGYHLLRWRDRSLRGTVAAGCSQSERKSDRLESRAVVSERESENMRAPLSPLLLAAAFLAVAGCASAPKEVSPIPANEPACENDAADPLHIASSRPDAERDWQIEAIMSQQPADPRLARINRQMYLTLHALDVELGREQRIAECENPDSSPPTLEAEAENGAGADDGGDGAGGESPMGGGGSAANSAGGGGVVASAGGVVAGGGAASGASPGAASGTVAVIGAEGGTGGSARGPSAANASAAPSAARSTLIRKTSLSAAGGGGNGATAQKINAASDNDIVARRLRKAAEQETDPALRAKLWKEYADYRQGMTGK